MSTKNVNLLWKDFKGIRKLNTINSDTELGAEIAQGVRLSKEKSGQNRSIKSAGWFNEWMQFPEPVIRLFAANISGYGSQLESNQLLAFTKTTGNINVWVVSNDSGRLSTPLKVAAFPATTDVTDVCMAQFGDRLVVAIAFGTSNLGFLGYSATELPGWDTINTTNFYYRLVPITEKTTGSAITNITQVRPYRSRLAINGKTTYAENGSESIFGVWFSEAGDPTNFNMSYLTSESGTTAFYAETGEYINRLEEYHGLTAFGRNRSFNITGTSAADYKCEPLVARGVFGNASFSVNGKCAYVSSYENNIFTLRDNLDGTIGFDEPIGDDISDFLTDVTDVTINAKGRRIRMLKSSGMSLVYDVDIGEWTVESFVEGARAVTFLNDEYFCNGTNTLYQITEEWGPTSIQTPDEDGYYSHYRTNLIWLDSQTSVKSHIYPLAIILEPNTSNDFYIKCTTDRSQSFDARITRAGFENVATYSNSDDVPANGSKFVSSDDDLSGRVFLTKTGTELLITAERPPFWRYLQIDIYTTSPQMQFNIAGIEAKNTFITDEQLDY